MFLLFVADNDEYVLLHDDEVDDADDLDLALPDDNDDDDDRLV